VFFREGEAEESALIALAVCVAAVWMVTAVNWYGFRFSKWLNDSGSALMFAAGIIVLIACGLSVLRQGFVTSFTTVLTFDVGTLGLWAQIAMFTAGWRWDRFSGGRSAIQHEPSRALPG
jgi:hypothetical protein